MIQLLYSLLSQLLLRRKNRKTMSIFWLWGEPFFHGSGGDESKRSPGMWSGCKQQNYRAMVFLYLCPLNFTTLAVFSRGQIATPRFVLPLPLLQHPVTHQLTSNPSLGSLMKRHLCTRSCHVPCQHRAFKISKASCKRPERWRLQELLVSLMSSSDVWGQ